MVKYSWPNSSDHILEFQPLRAGQHLHLSYTSLDIHHKAHTAWFSVKVAVPF